MAIYDPKDDDLQAQESDFKITALGSDKGVQIKTETLYVDINERIQLAIDMNSEGVSIRVYPITKGEYWSEPHEDFKVDMAEIEQLEKELEE